MEKATVLHFKDGDKIICGVADKSCAVGDEKVTCRRCIKLLNMLAKKEIKVPPTQQVPEDPKAIHFSDGVKAVCGAKNVKAVKDEQVVTCRNCLAVMAKKAEGEGNPLIAVRILNRDLNEGVDWNFCFERDPDNPKQMKRYHLINNAAHLLPRKAIFHLRSIGYPYTRYEPGQDSGHAMQVAGQYKRFMIQELSDDEKKELEDARFAKTG